MNDGITSGSGSSRRATRRPGRSVLATSQARTVPSTAEAPATETPRARVRASGPRVAAEAQAASVPPSVSPRTAR